jgi:hypothetical protein
MSLLDHHEPESWRFYRYGEDDEGEPLFSFWMNINDSTGVCIYDRSSGMWLSTHHDDEEYQGQPPSDELKAVLRDVMGTGGFVDADRVHALPDHERYFFQSVHGTIEQKGKAPDELLAFLSQLAGTEVRIE